MLNINSAGLRALFYFSSGAFALLITGVKRQQREQQKVIKKRELMGFERVIVTVMCEVRVGRLKEEVRVCVIKVCWFKELLFL